MVRTYDVVMTHKLDADDLFIHRVQQHCAEAGLNFFLVEPLWVQAFYDALAKGQIWARVLLNMHSEHHQPDDIYHRLVRLAAEQQVQVIDPPDRAQVAFDKARLHPQLIAAGIPVPFTVIVPKASFETFRLTEEQRQLLGRPFVIKPSMGYGRRGLVMDATTEKDMIRSMSMWPDHNYLFQRKIVPRGQPNGPAYFRVYYIFGSVFRVWWNCFTDHYRMIAAGEVSEAGLAELESISRRIASLTGMNFFSSEIAQIDSGEYVVIDYVNDQCHMLSQSANPQIGVPDELVGAIARRLVEAARQMVKK
ncbi:MAG TPA: hypothetical protein VKM56_09625 [Verrucomicrobiae bacterium]|nr:hypothetical protein [Verrucomicrobiae bacterium]